jgi:hypothetical protein
MKKAISKHVTPKGLHQKEKTKQRKETIPALKSVT